MAIVTETIRVVVTGANPQTRNFTVNVDTSTGNGTTPLTIPLTGVNSGTDTVTAFMDSHSLTSNNATLAWQGTNGPIAVGPVTIDAFGNNGRTKGWPGGFFTGTGSFGNVYPNLNAAPGANSLVLNQVAPNFPINGFNNQPTNIGPGGGYKLCPMVVVNQTATGTFSNAIQIIGTNDFHGGNADNGSDHAGFVLSVYGNLVVKTPGTYTIYGIVANEGSIALWIGGGVTASSFFGNNTSGSNQNAFPASSPKFGYSPLICADVNSNEAQQSPSGYVNFPKAGIYPFEAVFNQHDFQQFSGDNNGYFQFTYLSGAQSQTGLTDFTVGPTMFPVAISSAPPAGGTPTGDLRLTPVGGAANLVVQGATTNLTLTIQNVPYTSIPYVPILEGTAGNMLITNSGSNFVFPTFNGNAVNTTSAASNVFTLTGSNSAINGLFSVTSTGAAPAPFQFNYNGGAFAFATPGAQISSSTISVIADDIAWFDSANTTFDTYTGNAGSISFSIDIDYMTRPGIASVTPAAVNASGIAQAIQINLNKPMSPMQQGLYGTGNTVTISGSATGGTTVSSTFTPILDSAGFLQGWSGNITPPVSSTNGSTTLSLNISGTLTFLSGNQFVTQTVSYFNGVAATIQTLGGFTAPVGVSLTTVPASTTLSNTPQPVATQNGSYIQSGTLAKLYFLDANSFPGGDPVLNAAFAAGPTHVTFSGFSGSNGPGFLNGQTVLLTGLSTEHLTNHDDPYWFMTFTQPSGSVSNVGNPAPWVIDYQIVGSTVGITTLIGTEYTFDNPTSCTMQFFKKFINPASAQVNLGSPTSTPTSAITTTVGGKTVYQKVYQIETTFPVVTTSSSTGGQINLGFVVTDNTTGLSTTYQSTTTYFEQINLISPPSGGGGGGGGGGCFTAEVEVECLGGLVPFGELPRMHCNCDVFIIVNKTGKHYAELVVHENYAGWMLELAPGKLVTVDHLMMLPSNNGEFIDLWAAAEHVYPNAKRVWYEGTVYNLHVLSEDMKDKHFVLWNGDVAHNIKVLV